MDFTIKSYKELIKALVNSDYGFVSVNDYLKTDKSKFIVMRHDVEAKYENAFEFAKIQYKYGIRGTYYFRILEKCFKPGIVEKIAAMGYEAGYHYDDLTKCHGNFERAINRFEKNLTILNGITPIKTICMDGSPLSKYDNKALWDEYNYEYYGIKSEPYSDINFDEVFYLTDTGRRWDGWKVSIRDKVPQQEKWVKQGLVFHSTADIIHAANQDRLPDKIMFTFHPQRWNDKLLPWVKELVWQNVKNVGKRFLV